jgi:hypothetical protein
MWPFFLGYSLPPWLTKKGFFVMLTLLIPRKESMKSENLDVYLKPLVKELQMLWKGVTIVES